MKHEFVRMNFCTHNRFTAHMVGLANASQLGVTALETLCHHGGQSSLRRTFHLALPHPDLASSVPEIAGLAQITNLRHERD